VFIFLIETLIIIKKLLNYIKTYDSHFESVPLLREKVDLRVISMDVVLS